VSYVMISYSREDTEYVDQLERGLSAANISVWIDRRDLPVSLPWLEDVRYAISGALLVVVCESPSWERSKACALEFEAAHDQHVPVVRAPARGDPLDAVARIAHAGRMHVQEGGTLRTDLTRRAADWVRAGRSARLLARGRFLRRSRAALARSKLEPSPLVREFLSASSRRDRPRRALGWVGAGVLAICGLLLWLLNEVEKRGDKQFADATASLVQAQATATLLDADIFRALSTDARVMEAAVARHRPNGFVPRDRLMRALSTPVPVSSETVAKVPPSLVAEQSCSAARPRCTAARSAGITASSRPRSGVVDVLARDGGLVRRLTIAHPVSALAISPDGRTLAAAWGDRVEMLSIPTGSSLMTLRAAGGPVRAVRFTDGGRQLMAWVDPRRISTWDWSAAVVLADRRTWFVALSEPDAHGEVVAVQRDGDLLRVGTGDTAEPRRLDTGLGETLSASFSRDGRFAALISRKAVTIVDTTSGRVMKRRDVGCAPIASDYGSDGRSLFVTCANGPIRRLDSASLRERGRVDPGPNGAVKVLARGDELYVADGGSGVSLLRGGRVQGLTKHGCGNGARGLSVNRAATTMVVVGDGAGTIGCTFVGRRTPGRAWSIIGELLLRRPAQQARAAAISPDGRVVAVGYADGAVATFTLPDETPGWLWTGVSGSVRGLVFSRDGRHIVVATREGLIARLPACPSCFDTPALTRLATRRVADARRMGLTSG
jgi:WD40 repeat protein